jgi:hypothetical protein
VIHNFHRHRRRQNNIDNIAEQGRNPQDGHILIDIWSHEIAYADIVLIGTMQAISDNLV